MHFGFPFGPRTAGVAYPAITRKGNTYNIHNITHTNYPTQHTKDIIQTQRNTASQNSARPHDTPRQNRPCGFPRSQPFSSPFSSKFVSVSPCLCVCESVCQCHASVCLCVCASVRLCVCACLCVCLCGASAMKVSAWTCAPATDRDLDSA